VLWWLCTRVPVFPDNLCNFLNSTMALRELFHLLLAATFFFAIFYDVYMVKFPDVLKVRHDGSGGRFKYLTFWNLILQAIFFSASFINDIVGTREKDAKKRASLQRILDTVFASLGFPAAIFVFTSFWTLFLINRELVFPLMFDAFFPPWLNHVLHTLIFPAVVIEMLTVYHHYPQRKTSLSLLSFFTILYLICTFVIAYVYQFWTYPVLEVLNIWQRTLFIVVCTAVVSSFYFIGEFVHKMKWGMPISGSKQNKMKKKKST